MPAPEREVRPQSSPAEPPSPSAVSMRDLLAVLRRRDGGVDAAPPTTQADADDTGRATATAAGRRRGLTRAAGDAAAGATGLRGRRRPSRRPWRRSTARRRRPASPDAAGLHRGVGARHRAVLGGAEAHGHVVDVREADHVLDQHAVGALDGARARGNRVDAGQRAHGARHDGERPERLLRRRPRARPGGPSARTRRGPRCRSPRAPRAAPSSAPASRRRLRRRAGGPGRAERRRSRGAFADAW